MISVKSSQIKVAGCLVKSGTVHRGSVIEIRREGESIFTGKIRQLRHLKENITTITSGRECGVMLSESFQDFEEGDIIHCVEYLQQPRNLLESQE